MRIVALLLGLCALETAVMLGGCRLGDSEAYKLKARIAQAQRELVMTGTSDYWFTQDVRINRPFVVVLLPAEHLSAESIRSADLPFEAKESIQRQIEYRDFSGPLLGLVEADRSEWHPLPPDVSVAGVLYAWKQGGENVSVNVTRRDRRTVVAAIR